MTRLGHLQATLTIARYTVLESIRNRLFFAMLGLVLIAWLVGLLISHMAITDTHAIQSAAYVVLLRSGAVLLTAVFVISSTVRAFNDKSADFLFALPLPRAIVFFGRWLGFSASAALIALLCSLPLWFVGPASGVAVWTLSLMAELVVVVSISAFFALSLTHLPASLLATLGFYLLARASGTLERMATRMMNTPEPDHVDELLHMLVQWVNILLPRLDVMTQTAWLTEPVHLSPWTLWNLFTSIALLCCAALFDLYRKNL